MASRQDLQPHIYLPLPKTLSLKPKEPPKPQTKEERLRTILSNLEAHHAAVRNRLITRAKSQHQTLPSQQQDPQPQPTSPSALETLHQNLSTPYTPGTGDPSTTTTLPSASAPQQATPPPHIALAKETLDQIELYERHARPTREYYERALGRLTGSGVGVERSGRRESVGGARPAGPTRTASGTSSRGNVASPVDARGAGRW